MRTTKLSTLWLATAVFALSLSATGATAAPFRILVTNDDGVGAAGIAALVRALTRNPSLEVSVYAPESNQSGTGDMFTTDPLEVVPATTADGYPAFAVDGFPADGVLFGVLQGLGARPNLVISGINQGQNIGELVNISGTVGAALTAARMGIPAFAVSQGLGADIDFEAAAAYTANLVTRFRASAGFRSLLRVDDRRARVLNVNFPTCTSGTLRGVRAVPLGRSRVVFGYEPGAASDVWDPLVVTTPLGSNDCTSTLKRPRNDLDAMNNGFASVTPLDADLTSEGVLPELARYVER